MTQFSVLMIRHMISYRSARADDVDADTPEDAARIAEQLCLDWIEHDAIDEGPVDYAVTGPCGEICWREDGGETHGPEK